MAQDGVQRLARDRAGGQALSQITGVFTDVTRPSTLVHSGVIRVIPWMTSSGPLSVIIVNVRRPCSSNGADLDDRARRD